MKPPRRSVRPSSTATTTTRQRALQDFRLNERRSERRRAVHEPCGRSGGEELRGEVARGVEEGIGEISLPTNAKQRLSVGVGKRNGWGSTEKLQCETSERQNKFRKEDGICI